MDKEQLKVVSLEKENPSVKAEKSIPTELELFKGVVKSLVENSLKTMNEIGESYPELSWEKYELLYHYLDYLKRLCEGKA